MQASTVEDGRRCVAVASPICTCGIRDEMMIVRHDDHDEVDEHVQNRAKQSKKKSRVSSVAIGNPPPSHSKPGSTLLNPGQPGLDCNTAG
jgi:hypothetical protein